MQVESPARALAPTLVAIAIAGGCSRDPRPLTPPPVVDSSDSDLDASAAVPTTLQELAKKPADGLYVADAIVIAAHKCHCPPAAACDCPPDEVDVTNDLADSMSWRFVVRMRGDVEQRFAQNSRLRIIVSVEHGDAFVIGALPPRQAR